MEPRSRALEIWLGGFVLAVLVALVGASLWIGDRAPKDSTHYTLMFDNVLGLQRDNAVAVAGVPVGVVRAISVDGRQARVEVAVDAHVVLRADARAAVRARSLLGEKYVDLDPGTPELAALPPGSTLHQNWPTVDIDHVIRSAALLVDRLNAIVPPIESGLRQLEQAMAGEEGSHAAAELAQTIADAGGLIREAQRILAGSADDWFAFLRALRGEGPALLAHLRESSARADRLLSSIDPAVLARAGERLDPTLANVEQASGQLERAMSELQGASSRLDALLTKADRALGRLDQLDERKLREFLQVEGLRIHLMPDAKLERRVRELGGDVSEGGTSRSR